MYEYKAKLVRVVDGDTVDALIDCGFSTFRKERIRLYGINAPESRTRDKEEKKRGLAAKARLKEIIKEGKNEFIVETRIDKKGKYGRLLGTLRNGNIDKERSYNEILLDEGHATEYYGRKK
jgi:micrococcal nuclease